MEASVQNSKTLKFLEWRDILIVSLIMYGWFAYKSTGIWLGWIYSTDTGSTSGEHNYWPNLILQSCLLAIALGYLAWRKFDFKQLKIHFRWSVLFWAPVVFLCLGLLTDILNSLAGPYNYFDASMFEHIDWSFGGAWAQFAIVPPTQLLYSFLNGFYEELFFLGLATTVRKEMQLGVLIFSIIVRTSFHTYQGLQPALITGIGVGLMFYLLYRYKVKNLVPFFLAHAAWDMVGGSIMLLMTVWR